MSGYVVRMEKDTSFFFNFQQLNIQEGGFYEDLGLDGNSILNCILRNSGQCYKSDLFDSAKGLLESSRECFGLSETWLV